MYTDTRRRRIEIECAKRYHRDAADTSRKSYMYAAGYDSNGLLNNATQNIRLTPHIIIDQQGWVGAQRAAVETPRVSYELRVTSYELRVTSYEVLRNITIRLDANTNEPLTVDTAGYFYTCGWWSAIANLSATRRVNRDMSKTFVLAGRMPCGT